MTTTLTRHDRRAALIAVLLGIGALLLIAPDALAQQAGGGEDVGKNLGDLLQDWGTQIYLGIVATVSIVFLINRAYSQLGLFIVAAVVVGMFVVSPESFKNFAGDTAKTLFGS
jgi:hypothetical protein